MLPPPFTPSLPAAPPSFSWIIRSHNTLSSSFHSFFKVLLSFPSQYFFAIGFPVIFRLWWILSPIQSILPNKFTLFPEQFFSHPPTVTRLSLTLANFSKLFPPASAVESSRSRLHHDTRTPARGPKRYRIPSLPTRPVSFSFAITQEIIVIFFSFPYWYA